MSTQNTEFAVEQPAEVVAPEIVQLPLSDLALIGGGQVITSCY